MCNSIVVKKTFPWNENKKLCQERINLFVQLKSVYNISRPALEQYLEMSFQNCISIGDFDLQSNNSESTNSSNYKNKYSPRGMLMLNVTDGKNNFIAIESEYIPFLSEYFRPGIKIYIFGECKIANGIIHLTKKNCQVIGGEVSDDFSQNTLDITLFKLLPKNNFSEKDKMQAKKICNDKMKVVDDILNQGYTSNLVDFLDTSNDLPEELSGGNEILNKENENVNFEEKEKSLDCTSTINFNESNVSTIEKKICNANTSLNMKVVNGSNNCINKEVKKLTISEIFDYFFKLHIFLNENWISKIIQTVSDKYLDQNEQIKYIFKLFLQSDISSCLIGSSPEFRKGNQMIETSLLMEIDSIYLSKKDNTKNEKYTMEEKLRYKLNDGNKYYDAIIRKPIKCNTCNKGHLIPGIKLLINGQLEVDNNDFLILDGSNCKVLDEDFFLPTIKINDIKTVRKTSIPIIIDSD